MSHHPGGQTVEISGIKSPINVRCCEEHTICGTVLTDDGVVSFMKVQVIVNAEESTIAAFWVSDRADQCCIGFLLRHHVNHWKKLEEVLAQTTDVYTGDSNSPANHQKHYRNSGVAIGAIISGPLLVAEPSSPTKKCIVNGMTNGNQEQKLSCCYDKVQRLPQPISWCSLG